MLDFGAWIKRLEDKLSAITDGVIGLIDLPDQMNYAEMWRDGVSPSAAARETLEHAGYAL